MKRDMDLIRKILMTAEDSPGSRPPAKFDIEGFTPDQIGYHCRLLVNAGLASGVEATRLNSGPVVILTSLTWKGHEFLDAARDEGRWAKAKAFVRDKAGSVSIEIITGVLTNMMKEQIGLS